MALHNVPLDVAKSPTLNVKFFRNLVATIKKLRILKRENNSVVLSHRPLISLIYGIVTNPLSILKSRSSVAIFFRLSLFMVAMCRQSAVSSPVSLNTLGILNISS